MGNTFIPRILIVDDLFGRSLPNGRNEDRATLCGHYLLRDVTGDEIGKAPEQKIKRPVAEAVFNRGQRPASATIGDVVENDLSGVLSVVREGWCKWSDAKPSWSLVLLDLCFYTGTVTLESHRRSPGMPEGQEHDDSPRAYFGLRILEALHEEFPDLPVVILSSKPRAEVSREFSGHGALAFLERDAQESPELLQEYIQRHGLIPDESGEILGCSRSLLRALRAARRASRSRQNILIRGERGTGKELLAKYVHRSSLASGIARPLVTVDSGALSPELYASALFGHKKGAFTGADQNRKGSILEADGGDLFLDEIGNMPGEVQKALLRVLEYRRVVPLGGGAADSADVDVRFLSATNADIEAMASAGAFREDLSDRLREGGSLFLPPLRERPEDIPLLVEQFVRHAETATPGSLKRRIEPESLDIICRHPWPGNIRQLRSCILGAVGNHPDVEHLFPVHLEMPKIPQGTLPDRSSAAPHTPGRGADQPLSALVGFLESLRFDSMKPTQFAGKLCQTQEAWARFMVRYLKASLEATKRSTPDNPDGDLYVLPALRLLTGNAELKAWQAYDVIKRVFQISPTVTKECLGDPTLREILAKARKSRKRKSLKQ